MVQRYDMYFDQFGEYEDMRITEGGDYVLYSDYAKLEARVKELEAESKANREAYEYAWNAYQDLAKISLEDAWIPVEEIKPTKEDAVNNWVLWLFDDGSISTFNWDYRFVSEDPTHWKRIVLPE